MLVECFVRDRFVDSCLLSIFIAYPPLRRVDGRGGSVAFSAALTACLEAASSGRGRGGRHRVHSTDLHFMRRRAHYLLAATRNRTRSARPRDSATPSANPYHRYRLPKLGTARLPAKTLQKIHQPCTKQKCDLPTGPALGPST